MTSPYAPQQRRPRGIAITLPSQAVRQRNRLMALALGVIVITLYAAIVWHYGHGF